ncbi:LOW QUALITY PROTEIN: uncharacterized protein, partial [Embiotoca jacksoni]|uniref:LOW QUALITY PROTEIN: uncharacterized protein n=1 Tax=Embiotoca jacksoni TaxID=100190 RepID=UPI003703E02E
MPKAAQLSTFPKTTNAPLSQPRRCGAVLPSDTQAAADSPAAYSGHKHTVVKWRLRWQAPSTKMISSTDTEREYVRGEKKTQTAFLAVSEQLHTARAAFLSSVLILLDLSAAFDTVNHQILLSSLQDLGVSGSALSLFSSYLNDRTYRVAARISACLTDISQWMFAHHLKINLDEAELLFLPGKDYPTHDLTITFDNSVLAPTLTAKDLGVTLDSQLSLTANITATTRSCRYMLHNISRICPLLTQKVTQVLVQALVISRPDYCNSLLAGLPVSAIRPLQLIQNAAARLVFDLVKFSPLLRSLHWLPVAAHIHFKTLVLAYRAANRSGPVYIQDMVKPYIPARSLRSASTNRLVGPSLRAKHSTKSWLFAVLAPKWWNELPTDIRTAESLYIFRCKLKTHLFRL